MDLLYITILTLSGGLFSLIGSAYLTARNWWSEKINLKFVSFAAGVLITTSVLDLLPESLENSFSTELVFTSLLIGILFMFFMERFIFIFHHHHDDMHDLHPSVYLVLVGDTIHNLIDGISIAVAYMASPLLGLTTSFAVAAHEVPQEISEYSITVAGGVSRRKALILHAFSSLSCVLGGALAFFFFSAIEPYIYLILAFTAGIFLYIACADIIPELHEQNKERNDLTQSLTFLAGILVVILLRRLVEP